MRAFGIAFGALALFLVAVFALLNQIDLSPYKAQITNAFNQNNKDYLLEIEKELQISLIPLGVMADDIVVKTKNNEQLLKAQKLRMALEIWPLLMGKYTINHIEIDSPHVEFDHLIVGEGGEPIELNITELVVKNAKIKSDKLKLAIDDLDAKLWDIDESSFHAKVEINGVVYDDVFSGKRVEVRVSKLFDGSFFVENVTLESPHLNIKKSPKEAKDTDQPNIKIANAVVKNGTVLFEELKIDSFDATLKDVDAQKTTLSATLNSKGLVYGELFSADDLELEIKVHGIDSFDVRSLRVKNPIIDIDLLPKSDEKTTPLKATISNTIIKHGTIKSEKNSFVASGIEGNFERIDLEKQTIDASLHVEDIVFGEYHATNLSSLVKAKEKKAEAVKLEFDIFDSRVLLDGVVDGEKVEFDLELYKLDVAPFLRQFVAKKSVHVDVVGKINLDLKEENGGLSVDVGVNSGGFEFVVDEKELEISDIKANVKFTPRALHVSDMSMVFFDSLINSDIRYGLHSGEVGIKSSSKKLNATKIQDKFLETTVLKGELAVGVDVGFMKDDITHTINGEVKVYGSDLTLEGYNLDQMLNQYEDTQKVKLVDIGAFFLAGPLGVLATKSLDGLLVVDGLARGSSLIKEASANMEIKKGEFVFEDVAFSTESKRVAFSGGLSLPKDSYTNLEFAIVDSAGCSRYSNSIEGKLNSPQLDAQKAIISQVINPITSIVTSTRDFLFESSCDEPFYTGVVKDPTL